MYLALRFIGRLAFPWVSVLALACCAADPVKDMERPEDTGPAVEAVVDGLATASAGGNPVTRAAVTAEIVDVIDGGPAGEWGAKVDFPNGTGNGCYIDVYDKKSDTLLARDEVDSPDESTSHMVRFRYRGSADNLVIRATEKESGAVLAETEFR